MAKVIDGILYVTVKEAAETLATTAMRVLMLLREKRLIGVEMPGPGDWNDDNGRMRKRLCLDQGLRLHID